MDDADLDNRFSFHPANADTGPRHDLVRDQARQFASMLDRVCGGDCREKSLAMTALEEAMMWANAAIARHQ